jgi:two-component system chemotaxis response regulator CheB
VATPDVIVVGASAGGVEALRTLAAGLPADLPASVLIVLHVPRSSPSALPAILRRVCPLPVRPAADGEPLRHGRIYVARVDHHLLVIDGYIRLSRGPAENGHRPAIDPLFRSAARAHGPRVIGVVLSGTRDDGAAGLAAIALQGGTTIVQDPEDAIFPFMPQAALDQVAADHVVSVAKIGPLLGEITRLSVPERTGPAPDLALAVEVAMAELAPVTAEDMPGEPAGYGCPACGGSLFEVQSQPVPRYQCRVGHAWSPESLLEEQTSGLEGALWMALRALEEKASLSTRMAEATSARGHGHASARYRSLAQEAEEAGALIRGLIDRIGAVEDGQAVHSSP